jgi:GNAT superfamily N-acetyltransferase
MWAEHTRVGCADALVNSKLEGDYFFNRSRVSGCPDPVAASKQVAKIFWQKGMDCYLHDREELLEKKGFTQIDTMYVLVKSSAATPAASGKTVVVDLQLLPVWIDVFCKAFSVPEWRHEVERIMDANAGKMTLLLSYKESASAGCAALYTKNGMTGIYCLGTILQMRGRGLARRILQDAAQMSENIFLQTLGSEGLLPFYQKAGFKVAYAKKIYRLGAYSN